MNKLLIVLIAFAVAGTAFAQNYAIGRPAEMKNLTDIYIDTRADLKDYRRIEKELLAAKLPGVRIVEDERKAQIYLLYRGDMEEGYQVWSNTTATGSGSTTNGMIKGVPLIAGEGMVFLLNLPPPFGGGPRLVLRYENQQESQWEQKPTTKFVRAFVKEWRRANGLK